jgi:hypothetical protein
MERNDYLTHQNDAQSTFKTTSMSLLTNSTGDILVIKIFHR